ncbi:MAG: nucleotidyltransferase domain-containing protein [Candidatus Pacearchaeota archaeon]
MARKKIKQKRDSEFLKEAEARSKVMYWFFAYPSKSFSLNDLVQNLEVSKTTVNRVVKDLIKEGFLEKEEIGKTWKINCNRQHPFNEDVKIPYNLSLVYQSGIVDAIYDLYPSAKAIVLFGSYRKGDDNSESDLDIAVELLDDEPLEVQNLVELAEFGYRKNVPVNLHMFSRNKVDLNVFCNIANGIVLSGFLEVRP